MVDHFGPGSTSPKENSLIFSSIVEDLFYKHVVDMFIDTWLQ